jgi:hypothetical protein
VADELVDPRAMERLAGELYGSREIAHRFVADFVATWQCRLTRLSAALAAEDLEDAYVTLLSIRTTSVMIGAVQLARVAGALQDDAHAGRLASCRAGMGHLTDVGTRTMAELA